MALDRLTPRKSSLKKSGLSPKKVSTENISFNSNIIT